VLSGWQSRATTATYGGPGEHGGPITTVAVVDDRQFLTGSWDKTARLWDAEVRAPRAFYHVARWLAP